ncbi:MAG TPA: Glu-tRNA(Gln) amidotransferase subunit GatD [Thermoplasmata archaeon]|nr:Glu-tRNA(Gln) amidotransferase subunit GatD [Thermoplasmata archaeon]
MPESTAADPWATLRALPLGQRLELTDVEGRAWTGTVIPAHELSAPRVLTLKLDTGYNVGIRVGERTRFRLLGAPPPSRSPVTGEPPAPPSAGGVALLTTGGTIASRVDYETGAVKPVQGEAEILALYPELREAGSLHVRPVMDVLSENLGPGHWVTLAEEVAGAFREGAEGVVIAHGTDTLGFTAAGLSFLLADLPGPVVLVGAQRSPDRPSSDGPSNVHAAVQVARDRRLGEVVVVMHDGLSDGRFAIHRGPWVRKMHSSRRDAFRSRNAPPIGVVEGGKLQLSAPVRAPTGGPARVDGPLDLRGGLLWSYPGLEPARAAAFAEGLRGVVLAGTGLGHIAQDHLDWIGAARDRGVVVAMTTQCLEGIVDPFVYATGRELLARGVLYLDDLLPETAYAKLLWALGHADRAEEVRALMLRDRAGEFVRRRPLGEGPA